MKTKKIGTRNRTKNRENENRKHIYVFHFLLKHTYAFSLFGKHTCDFHFLGSTTVLTVVVQREAQLYFSLYEKHICTFYVSESIAMGGTYVLHVVA